MRRGQFAILSKSGYVLSNCDMKVEQIPLHVCCNLH